VCVLGENGLCSGNVKKERETGSEKGPKVGLKLRSLEAQLHTQSAPHNATNTKVNRNLRGRGDFMDFRHTEIEHQFFKKKILKY